MATTATAERRLLPPLAVEEQQELAAALVRDAMAMFRGKAGATLAITDASGACITARSKPLEVIAFRMAQYRAVPLLFGLFIRRHDDGSDVWRKLQTHFEETFPEVEL